jgi:hypothetical protein
VGLAAPGRRFWREVMEGYTLDPDDRMILEKACRVLDRLARKEKVEAELAERGELVVGGSRGQPAMHPICEDLRRDNLLLSRLVEQLALPNRDQEIGTNVASKRAQKAAQARWSGGRQTS